MDASRRISCRLMVTCFKCRKPFRIISDMPVVGATVCTCPFCDAVGKTLWTDYYDPIKIKQGKKMFMYELKERG